MSKLIVLDPGHDREEPGATQIDGESENGYTLRLAHAVQDALLAGWDCQAVLTHDTLAGMVPGGTLAQELEARGELPNKLGAAFFLSLHHNAGPALARGAEFYIWTDRRRANGDLLWLPAVADDGTAYHKAPKSYAMAQVGQPIIKAALAAQGIPWHGVSIQCADFAVLRYPNCPCWLLETHYGTNQQDDDIADRPEFIAAVADGIAEAVAVGLGLQAQPAVWTLPKVKVILLDGTELWGEVKDGKTVALLPGESGPAPVRKRAESVGAQVEWTPVPPTVTLRAGE